MVFYNSKFILILIKNSTINISYRDKVNLFFESYNRKETNNINLNILYLVDIIKDFILKNKISSKNLIIILEDDIVYQDLSKDLKKINIEDCFITNEDIKIGKEQLIYQVAVKNSQIFQFNLISFLSNLKLICLTTEFICWYYFYKINFFNLSDNLIKELDNLREIKVAFKNLFSEKVKFLVKDWPQDILKNINKDNLITIIGAHNLID